MTIRKIKIAHIITRMILGGAQENTLLSVEGLQALPDFTVDLITGPALGPEGSLLERARKNNVSIIEIPFLRRAINPLYDLCAFIHVFLVLRKNKYDIVHTHSSKAGILCRLAAFCARVPLIMHTIHGLAFHPYERSWLNALYILLEKIMAPMSTALIAVCPEMIRKSLSQRIGRPEQYHTIYSGIEIDQYDRALTIPLEPMRLRYALPPQAIVIGKIARLFHLKGHEFLLEAAHVLIKKYPHVYFLFVGDGILKSSLEQKAKEYGIDTHIRFTGLIPPEEIPLHISLMDVVVHVSLREGLPRVIPQAFLMKKPVIAYDIDGAKDIIDNALNGFLVAPESVHPLINHLERLITSKEMRIHMGEEGRKKAEILFPATRMVEHLADLYRQQYQDIIA